MTDTVETAATAAAASLDAQGRRTASVNLDNPLKRPEGEISAVSLRKPMGGDLRGTKLADLYNMDVLAMAMVIPRISNPVIHKTEFMAMDGEDIAALSGEVVNFLLPKRARSEAGLEA
jgi:hypothetical protein